MTRWRGLYMLAAMVGLSGVLSAPAHAGPTPPAASTTAPAGVHAAALMQQHEAAPAQGRTATHEPAGDEASTSTSGNSQDQVAAPAASSSAAQRYALLFAGLGVMVWLRRRSTASQ